MSAGHIGIRRVVLALTPDGASDAALRSAAELARLLSVSLHAVFLEEEAALQAAELGFGAEVSLSGAPRRIDRSAIEADFERLARRLHRRLDAIAQRARLTCDFERLRGAPAEKLRATIGAGDLVALFEPPSAGDRAVGPHASLRRAARAGMAAALLSPLRLTPEHGGVVLLAADAADAEAQAFAERIAVGLGARLLRLPPERLTSGFAEEAGASRLLGSETRLLILGASLAKGGHGVEALLKVAARTCTPALALAVAPEPGADA